MNHFVPTALTLHGRKPYSLNPNPSDAARTRHLAAPHGITLNRNLSLPPTTAGESPRVRVQPSADGVTSIIGVTVGGKWVAEFRCCSEDFDDTIVLKMDQRVREKERDQVRLMG